LRPPEISSTLFELSAESPHLTRYRSSLSACKDTKTLQENEQLKAQVADLQRQNGELGNNLETVTAARDALIKENESLQVQLRSSKTKTAKKKVTSRKRHHS
jgi:regulator of replication initiation timing